MKGDSIITNIYSLVTERDTLSCSVRFMATFISLYGSSVENGSAKACEQGLLGWTVYLPFTALKNLIKDRELKPVSFISVLILSSALQIPTIACPHTTI